MGEERRGKANRGAAGGGGLNIVRGVASSVYGFYFHTSGCVLGVGDRGAGIFAVDWALKRTRVAVGYIVVL